VVVVVVAAAVVVVVVVAAAVVVVVVVVAAAVVVVVVVEGLVKRNADCFYIKSFGHAGGPNMVQILSERLKVTDSYEVHGRISVRCAVRFWERS
jgi:hypothetical protein